MREDVRVEAHHAAAGKACSGLQVSADDQEECSWRNKALQGEAGGSGFFAASGGGL